MNKTYETLQPYLEKAKALQTALVLLNGMMRRWRLRQLVPTHQR